LSDARAESAARSPPLRRTSRDNHPVTDVLVLGDANADLVLRGDVVPRFGQAEQLLDAADFTLGGSGAIVACGLARLGVEVAIVAAIGEDAMGRLVTDALHDRGVSVEQLVVRPDVATGISVILSGDERSILTYAGAIASLSATDLDTSALTAAAHVHSASPYLLSRLAPDLPRLLAAARAAGATITVDTNDDPARTWDGLADLLSVADVALPNDGELAEWVPALTSAPRSSWPDDARAVAALGPTVVVKRGAAGGALVAGERLVEQPATSVNVVDTTGAGDSFDAAWIAARLRGLPPEEALRWAVAAGGLSTRGAGGTAHQGTADEVAAAASALPSAVQVSPSGR
jgi:ribokinase